MIGKPSAPRLLRVAGLLMTLAVVVPGVALAGPEKPALVVQTRDGLLTVSATNVPHRQILEGLARELGFKLVIVGPLDEPRSLTVEGRPWEDALKKAIAPASWTFVYQSASGKSTPAMVFVLAPGARMPSQALRPDAPSAPPAADAASRERVALTAAEEGQVKAAITEMLQGQDEETLAMIALLDQASTDAGRGLEAWLGKLVDKDSGLTEITKGLRQALGNQPDGLRNAAEEAVRKLLLNPE